MKVSSFLYLDWLDIHDVFHKTHLAQMMADPPQSRSLLGRLPQTAPHRRTAVVECWNFPQNLLEAAFGRSLLFLKGLVAHLRTL